MSIALKDVYKTNPSPSGGWIPCDILRLEVWLVPIVEKATHVDAAVEADSVRAHLHNIVESPSFRGSRRSQEFLQFIVDQALNHHFDDLKERTLGVEIFGRPATYDTSEDAIVRVTACDVRKRLHQYYSQFGAQSVMRLELPTGSYVPEFRHVAAELSSEVPAQSGQPLNDAPADPDSTPTVDRSRNRLFLRLALLVVGIATISAALWAWTQRRSTDSDASVAHTLPWSAIVHPNRTTHIVFCDPEIVMVQRLLDYSVTLSDYANQHYWPTEMNPEIKHVFQTISFRGSSVAAVDAAAALRIENLVAQSGKPIIQTHTARSLRLTDFKSEDSFVLFGSPRSNPWVRLFDGQLDFTFEFDNSRKAEFVKNRHPLAGELAAYVPTAAGFGTGDAYAIIALASNPDQNGRVVLLEGSNAEATEAACKLAVDLEAFSLTMKAYSLDPASLAQNFEILLRVSTMAGSSNTYEVIAVHKLNIPSSTPQQRFRKW
jgi:hypothetical protein